MNNGNDNGIYADDHIGLIISNGDLINLIPNGYSEQCILTPALGCYFLRLSCSKHNNSKVEKLCFRNFSINEKHSLLRSDCIL